MVDMCLDSQSSRFTLWIPRLSSPCEKDAHKLLVVIGRIEVYLTERSLGSAGSAIFFLRWNKGFAAWRIRGNILHW